MLDGTIPSGCQSCQEMEQHGKVSGRQKQLLKIGVTVDSFEKTFLSSPWLHTFQQSQINDGDTDQIPQDWQIDLGNYCNSGCLFCSPWFSSKLAAEHKKLGLISQMPPPAWCDDPQLLDKFINALRQSHNLAYLHFIGGETVITPAFKTILKSLVHSGLADQATIGFTTNLTVWDQEIVDLLREFRSINLGMSVECLNPLNDYVRYGSEISTVISLIDRWIEVARQHQWLIQLRITPTVLSIWYLHTIYQFAIENGLAVESCDFIQEPAFMRPSVLPRDMRQQAIDRLQTWIQQQQPTDTATVINIRNPNFAHDQVIQDAKSYVRYLEHQPDESWRAKDLVQFLKIMESNRQNCVLDHLPEYEQFFRSFGY